MQIKNRSNQTGFTIVELLIATAVLSTILVLVSVVMVNIGKLYYKGINQSRVQDDVRSITDEVAQHLELGDSYNHVNGAGGEQAYCIGNTRYTYVLHRQIGTGSSKSAHVLWRDQLNSPADCASLPDLSSSSLSGGTEMIAPNSRLTTFSIVGTSPYALSVGVAYGDDDLLNDPNSTDARCKGDIGDQFCATAHLQTTVVRRLPAS